MPLDKDAEIKKLQDKVNRLKIENAKLEESNFEYQLIQKKAFEEIVGMIFFSNPNNYSNFADKLRFLERYNYLNIQHFKDINGK